MADQDNRWSLIDDLFHGALAHPVAARHDYLVSRVDGDTTLLEEVEALLDADGERHVLLDSPRPTDLPSGLRIGPYALERILGSGGMSTVYLAHRADRTFEKQVAIKVLNQGLTAALAGGRFETEQRVLARLEHANIARLLDAGFNEFGQPYLVMEWVDGTTLDTWLSVHRPALSRALDLWLQLASAVAYAHRNLVVHRDIKPSNVLVDRDEVPKLVDFGIAKLVGSDDEATQARTQHFTPRYASPEQLLGTPVTTAADVFGLGLLLCEMTVGQHPFARPDTATGQHTNVVLHEDPVLPASTPADLAAIIRMALRKEPERRYASVEAFAADVRNLQRGWPVSAQPESYRYRLRKFVTRHRLGVAAAALAFAAATAGTTLYVRQARSTAVERDRANLEAQKSVQVTRFLQNMLGAADPAREGRDIRVVDVLDRAGDRLSSELRTQPEVEAELRSTLAATYQGLGVFDPAVTHRRRALELREQLFGESDSRVAVSLVELGDALYSRGEYKEAESHLRRALAIFEKNGAGESVDAATGRRYLAEVLNEIGETPEAERLYREALALYRRLLPGDDERMAGLLNDLGVLLGNRQDYTLSEPLHREALAIMRRVHGPGHITVAQTLNNLAGVVDFQKRYNEAEGYYREALAIQVKLLGENHDRVVLTRTSLANMFWMKGDYQNAEAFARTALAGAERGLPAGHPLTAYAQLVLGQSLTDAKRAAEGEPHLRAALAMRKKVLPAGHWLIANTESVLGGCLTAQRRYQEAEDLLVPAYARLLADRGEAHERTLDARQRLFALYEAWGRHDVSARYAPQPAKAPTTH